MQHIYVELQNSLLLHVHTHTLAGNVCVHDVSDTLFRALLVSHLVLSGANNAVEFNATSFPFHSVFHK